MIGVFLGSALAAVPAASGVEAPGTRAADTYTPLVQSVMSKPRWFRDREGRVRLVYELKLTNGFPIPVEVREVSVRDVDRRRTIEVLDAAELPASMTLMATPGEPETTVPASGIGVVWMEVGLPSRRAVPRAIKHRLTVDIPPGYPVPQTITSTGGFSRVDTRPPVTLGPPMRGRGWVAVGSCCDGPHRRSVQPVNGRLWLGQRFAIDWNGVDDLGRFVVGDPSGNDNWTFYGRRVIAVADARVVEAVDRFPDQIPNAPVPVTIEQADGNYVILDLGKGRFAFYAHLKPGSVRVKRGDVVREGELLGRLGNSGSSTGPHLHFHVMNRPSALASDGLPYVFDRYRYDGRIPPLDDALAALLNSGQPVPIDTAGAGPRRRSLPLGRDVISFRGG
jgi:Peptidase family M23